MALSPRSHRAVGVIAALAALGGCGVKDPPRVAPDTVVLLGESITQNNGSRFSQLDGPWQTSEAASPRGFFVWADYVLRQRLRLVRNAGKGGDTSAAMLARIGDVTSVKPAPGWVLCEGAGGNDAGTLTGRQTEANLKAIYDRIRAALPATRLVIFTQTPRRDGLAGQMGITGTSYRSNLARINGFVRRYARSHRGVIFYDAHADVTDPRTGALRAGWSYDGIHPNYAGALRWGRRLAAFLRPLIGDGRRGAVSRADGHNVLGAATRFAGSGGTLNNAPSPRVAAGWAITAPRGTSLRLVARRGAPGRWQQMTLRRPGTVALARPVPRAALVAGAVVAAEADIETGRDWSRVTDFGMAVDVQGRGHGAVGAALSPELVGIPGAAPVPDPGPGVIRVPDIRVPAGAARGFVYFQFRGAAGTVRLGRARLLVRTR
jgi:lysophospholipase L1-like esterase